MERVGYIKAPCSDAQTTAFQAFGDHTCWKKKVSHDEVHLYDKFKCLVFYFSSKMLILTFTKIMTASLCLKC